jgi:aryl-alcohol dehydrogenase-like predicted oxidoreductase
MQLSLQKLKRPVDIFLLHDLEVELAKNPDIIDELIEIKNDGSTQVTGISGTAESLKHMIAYRPDVFEVAQLENSLKHPAPVQELKALGATVITHRAIQGGLRELQFLLQSRPNFKQTLSREIGVDLHHEEEQANALIELALFENKGGTILFSSTKPDRIKKIAGALVSPRLGDEGCLRLRSIFNDVFVAQQEESI